MDFNTLFQAQNVTDQYDSSEVSQLQVSTILAYIFPFLFFLPKVKNGNSQYANFIGNQTITMFVGYVISVILMKLPIIGFLGSILSIVIFILAILGIIDAVNGGVRKLPIIHQVTIQAFK